MKRLNKYLVSEYIKIFFGSLFFFVMLLTLADIIPRMEHYFEFPELVKNFIFFHLTRAAYNAYFSFPLSSMFASTFILGTMVKNKEMLACYNAGVSLFRFATPLFIFVISLSVLLIPYWEYIVSPFNEISFVHEQIAYHRSSSTERNNILFFGSDNYVYHIDSYNNVSDTMSNLVLLKKDNNGDDESRIKAKTATWDTNKNIWIAKDVSIVDFNFPLGGIVTNIDDAYNLRTHDEFILDVKEEPRHFQREKRFETLSFSNIKELIDIRKSINTDTKDLETEFQFRLAFAFAPFVIVVLSTLFAKFSTQSVLVVSLAFVIISALIYYTILMLGVSFGRSGSLPPIVGAWAANFIFLATSTYIFRRYY